jgi:hypothetical protein
LGPQASRAWGAAPGAFKEKQIEQDLSLSAPPEGAPNNEEILSPIFLSICTPALAEGQGLQAQPLHPFGKERKNDR